MAFATFANRWVQFVLKRDPEGIFCFAALQSEIGKSLAKEHGIDATELDTIILLEEDKHYIRSTAVIKIIKQLGLPWRILGSVFQALPVRFRDWVIQVVFKTALRIVR